MATEQLTIEWKWVKTEIKKEILKVLELKEMKTQFTQAFGR